MHPALLAIPAVILLVLILRGMARRDRESLRQRVQGIVSSNYSVLDSLPVVDARRNYGFPFFRLTFSDKEALLAADAAGLNASFLAAIQEQFAMSGSRARPFEAKRAVSFDYPGRIDELIARRASK